MEQEQGYYRYPTVAAGQVVFVSEDDLWQVPLTGGTARRLTAGRASAGRPWLSPDGRWLVFAGREEGDTDLYLMPGSGGEARRITWLGAATQPAGWTADGRILLATNARRPFRNWVELWTLELEGGEPAPLGWGPASAAAFGPDGAVVLGRNTADPARWKRYRGGTRGVLWIRRSAGAAFEPFPVAEGNLASPMWIGDRIYFLSDHEGIGNLYSVAPDGSDLRRHTHHADYYARNASTDGTVIVYHAGAELWAYDPGRDLGWRIEVDYHSQRTQRQVRHPEASRFWTGFSLSPAGERLAVVSRGHLYTLGCWEGPVTEPGEPQGVRYRLPQWTDSGRIVVVSDAGGEEHLELLPADPPGPARAVTPPLGRITELAVAPDGRWAAAVNHRYEVWLINLEAADLDGAAVRIDRSEFGAPGGLAWSPDSRWLAYACPDSATTVPLRVCERESRAVRTITRPVIADSAPAWDPEGRYLYFLSARVFDPVYDTFKFDLGFPRGMRPYLLPLTRDTRSPFLPEPRPLTSPAGSGEGPGPVEVRIDFEGILDRVQAFPLPEGRYLQLAAGRNRIYYTTLPVEGSLDSSFYPGEPPARATLAMFDLETLKAEELGQHVTAFCLDREGRTLAVRSGRRLRVVKAGDKLDESKTQPGRESGLVDLDGRVVVTVDPPAEWEQMLREAWRLMRDNFWTPDMSGVDWEAVYARYRRLLPRVSTRSEFSDLMWEMQGELGTSHAYELGGDYRKEPEHRQGYLGADLRWDPDAGAWVVTAVVRGDSWAEDADSALAAPGVNLQPGDQLLAIDGRPLDPTLPPARALIDKGGKPVQLVWRRPGEPEPRRGVVRALKTEQPLYYRAWVEANRRRVHERSGGRVGYVHVPDMGPRGFAEFHRAYLAEYRRDGLIVDVRFNGGGHVSQL
ncbi:MAG: PDZ domain-containing protein, partial [Firmicutes bacterium]|nr:PDZ domain-containing protein [Bacillota bacterium]